ncbi:hypothetical protein H6F43_03985 [Leptolyngbya sp. FACHB-36]|nr:hypothetical protein [Leptolyngbya sp. FACHB-36]MBD2019343.1 hypothetical protein [Leptolyngbya sp. FACHB-36]
MTRNEFCTQYLDPQHVNTAKALLPDEVHSLDEWRSLWNRILNSPAY